MYQSRKTTSRTLAYGMSALLTLSSFYSSNYALAQTKPKEDERKIELKKEEIPYEDLSPMEKALVDALSTAIAGGLIMTLIVMGPIARIGVDTVNTLDRIINQEKGKDKNQN